MQHGVSAVLGHIDEIHMGNPGLNGPYPNLLRKETLALRMP